MIIYCKEIDELASLVQNQGYYLSNGHKYWPKGCLACRGWLCDFDSFAGNDNHTVITGEMLERIRAEIARG